MTYNDKPNCPKCGRELYQYYATALDAIKDCEKCGKLYRIERKRKLRKRLR